MKRCLAFLLRQNIPLNIVFLGVVLYGVLVAVPEIPIDRFPNFSFGQAHVMTLYPGAAPTDVERLVTRPIEDSIRGMKQVDWVSSISVHGQSEVLVKFIDDSDYAALYDEMRLRVLGVQNSLPVVDGDPLQPEFEEIDTDSWVPVLQLSLAAKPGGPILGKRALALLAKELRDRLELLPGVKRVDLMGDEAQQFLLDLDPDLLVRNRVTLTDTVAALRASGHSMPAGTLDTELGERTVRVDTRYRTRDEVLNVVVRMDGEGSFVRVGDLVDPAASGIRRISGTVISSINGRDTVGCKVLKSDDANAFDIREDVVRVMEEFKETHASESIDVLMTLDSTVKIEDSMAVLYDSFMLALTLVIATLFFFMTRSHRWIKGAVALATAIAVGVIASSQNGYYESFAIGALALIVFVTCRSAVLTVGGIVFSFLGTLVIFYLAGHSLNEISLLGFVLTVGIIVDDAIIVLENIQRHREGGKPLARAALDGASEVAWPVLSATLTTCAAFLPMLLMTGTTGDFFAILPIAVATALAISLVECLVLMPLHSLDLERWFGRERGEVTVGESLDDLLRRPGIVGSLTRLYDRALCWNLAHPVRALGMVLFLFALAIGVVVQSAIGPARGQQPMLTLSFFPEDTSLLNFRVRLPSGSSLTESDRVVREISRDLCDRGPGVIRNCSAFAGLTVDTTYRPSWNHQFAFILVELPPRGDWEFDDPVLLIDELRGHFKAKYESQGIRVEITAQQDGPPTGAAVSVRVLGRGEDEIVRLGLDLFDWMLQETVSGGQLEGVIDLTHDRERVDEHLAFEPDLDVLERLGMTPIEVQQFIAGAFDGVFVGDFLRPDGEIPVRVRLKQDDIVDPTEVLDVPIRQDSNGRIVRFADLGTLVSDRQSAALRRRNFQRTISISGNLSGNSRLNAAAVQGIVADWYDARRDQYPGASLSFHGEAEHTAKSFKSLFIAFGLAVFLIYLILATQFRSFIQPVIILSNVVFSFTGVILVMAVLAAASRFLPDGWVRPERSMLTISSFIAIVGLTGIVVNDAIVLIDFINQRRAEALGRIDALRLAGIQRMRPILMTTISTIAGLIPMSIGIPYFSTSWSPFATCFVAGLTVSTAMTLLVIPVLYDRVSGRSVTEEHEKTLTTE